MPSTRRTFLKAVSSSAAVAAMGSTVPTFAAEAGPVRVWATFRDRRHQSAPTLVWRTVAEVDANAIVLDPSAIRQEILGFGAAMTDAACYILSQMPADARAELLHDFFAPDQMAFNVCRTCIGASDYSRSVYSFDDSTAADPELKHFSIDHDKAYILPALRDARGLNPELFLFSSPWSPPGWMKSSGTMLGGAMRKPSFPAYARYFQRFLEAYKQEGVTIDAVTVQNEVDTDQDGRMPACLWAQEHEIEFVGHHLGPLLRKASLDTRIWVLDHNYNLWGRAIDELSDADAAQYIDGVAWHGYFGPASAMTRVHDAFPQKSAYWTEGGPDISAPDYQTDFTRWAITFCEVLNNWARSITSWNLVLDEQGKPNIGPFSCGGVVTVENGSHKLTRSGQYWAFAHFSRHIRRGARVIASNGVGTTSAKVSHLALRNPDGSHVVILANGGAEETVQLVLGGQELSLTLPADSVHTLSWG